MVTLLGSITSLPGGHTVRNRGEGVIAPQIVIYQDVLPWHATYLSHMSDPYMFVLNVAEVL